MMKTKLTVLCLSFLLLLAGCATPQERTQERTEENGSGKVPDTSGQPSASEEVDPTPEGVGAPLDDLGAYDGYFDGESADLHVDCLLGTQKAYKLEGSTLTFTAVDSETAYAISGNFRGNIVIDVGDDYKFELEFRGFSLISDSANPITVLSGEEVSLKAKKGYANYIYDDRTVIDSSDETLRAGAISSDVDLEIGGKGKLTVVSKNNNGIHTKDDLQVKNLTLLVACADNALKGNDSVTLTGGEVTLIATEGDGIKTSSTDFSPKGKQRGSVSIVGGTHTVYAASDGIDAAYNVTLDDGSTHLTVYTDRYSNHSKTFKEIAQDGNPDLADQSTHSSKGIRAGNVIVVNDGTVNVKSCDASVYASKTTVLENGASPIGNVTVNGGELVLDSDAVGLHADGTLKIVAGTVSILDAREGLEGAYVDIYGGSVSVNAKDDGISATASAGEAVRIRGGNVYIHALGDGIDSNSQSEYRGVTFSGGHTVIVSMSSDNAAIDTEQGYAYEGGLLLAVMTDGETVDRVMHCLDFASVGKVVRMTLSAEKYLTAKIGEAQVTLRTPDVPEAAVVVLGDASALIALEDSVSVVLGANGVAWN